jgi:putative ABC transport system ATP-binding protein
VTATEGVRVELVGVRRTYPRGNDEDPLIAVDDISLSIEAGAAVALTGPSGSGKSTVLHLVGAIDRPDSGNVIVDDVDVALLSRKRLPAYRRRVGFVFQRYNLLPALTALDNVLAPVLPYRVDFDKVARASELLAQVGLADRVDALPSRLSGGQQQRVAIARALIGRPRLLLADEPTGNLDSRTGTEILDRIMTLRAASGMTVIIATHDVGVAARCERVVRLRDGAIVEDHDLTAAPVSAQHLTDLG